MIDKKLHIIKDDGASTTGIIYVKGKDLITVRYIYECSVGAGT